MPLNMKSATLSLMFISKCLQPDIVTWSVAEPLQGTRTSAVSYKNKIAYNLMLLAKTGSVLLLAKTGSVLTVKRKTVI